MTKRAVSVTIGAFLTSMLCACGGGGGGGSRYSDITLENIVFADPGDQSTGGQRRAPDNASLVQRIEFVFSGPVSPDEVHADSLEIRDLGNNVVPGRYVIRDRVVTFYPSLPTEPLQEIGLGRWETGGAGLEPGTFYGVTVPVGTPSSISTLLGVSPRLWEYYDYVWHQPEGGFVGRNYRGGDRSGVFSIRFKTTSDPEKFLTGYDPKPPRLTRVFPDDGAIEVSPYLYSDPDNLYAKREPYRLTFDQPLDPSALNISDEQFKLINVEDASGGMKNLVLGTHVRLIENEHDFSVVEVAPSGLLPFGNLLSLVYSRGLRNVSGGGHGSGEDRVASIFRIANASNGATVSDVFLEDFDSTNRREENLTELGLGFVPAEWNVDESNVLQAGFSFERGGELGPFVPIFGDPREIILDTNSQSFPLFDGSTPEAPPGTVVQGGVFNFTDIVIPEGITVRVLGNNPLVLTATGDVVIEGTIDISGARGGDDNTNDSAIVPTPGGSGGPNGGRGGDGNPSIWDGNSELMRLVPPRFGARGGGPENREPTGGFGGEGGIRPDPVIACGAAGSNNNSRGAGGGGGSYFTSGTWGREGAGAQIAVSLESLDPENIQRPLFVEIEGPPRGGGPGDSPFVDADPENDFIGPLGEVTELIGGTGGGGGGNRSDSFHCWATYPGWPGVTNDSKAGAGGGGGGAFSIRALGTITLRGSSRILAGGGDGGCGEQIGCSTWGGSGGGGSGGTVVLQSSTAISVLGGAEINVTGGAGCLPTIDMDNFSCTNRGDHPGRGGNGGAGIIQIHVPVGMTPSIDSDARLRPRASLIDFERTPSELTSISAAQSVWIDVGRAIERGPESPSWSFRGTDKATGLVVTDENGFIPAPQHNRFKIDLPPVIDPDTGKLLLPKLEDHIPLGAWVKVEFQAADAIAPGSKEVDPATVLPAPGLWATDPSIADGHQFIRYRVTFNIADTEQGYRLSAETRKPVMRFIGLPFKF